MINEKLAIKYCKNDISLIENYDKAIADKSQVWHCHHRRETIYSRSGLIEIGEYYNRPACELIFLTPNEHHKLHNLGKKYSKIIRKRMSESHKGQIPWNKGKQGLQHMSIEARKKMSAVHNGKPSWIKGKHHSAETRKKISEALKGEKNPRFGKPACNNGKHHSAETRKKISEALKGEKCYIFGKHHSAETRTKMSESHKGNHWYNNGVTSIQAKTCPKGFVPGRIK